MEVKRARDQRDALNTKVKTLKEQREQTRAAARKEMEEIKKTKRGLMVLRSKRPRQASDFIMRKREEIEWKIQTSSLTLEEERRLVEKADQLGTQLEVYKRIGEARATVAKLQKKVETMNEEADIFHQQLSELADQSQELHQKMMQSMSRAKTLQAEADHCHQIFLENKAKFREIHNEYVGVGKRLRELKRELAEAEEGEKASRQQATRKELKEKTLEKLKRGEKLTFEEFRLLGAEEEAD